VVKCSYIKGDGDYKEERMKQVAGKFGVDWRRLLCLRWFE
jgi:hypothetical protein